MIEAPKRNLKGIHQRILSEILDLVPAHPAAHGFVKARSIQTFAGQHVGQRVVLRMFRAIGYPEALADLLGGLCTNALRGHGCMPLYAKPHLPQGAPSFTGACQYLQLSDGLPSDWTGAGGGSGLQPLGG